MIRPPPRSTRTDTLFPYTTLCRSEEALGPIGLLANNAGANFPVLAENISANAWGAVTRIAIDGTFLCSAEFARRRIARGEGGAIVVNSAQYIWTGFQIGRAHV